MEGFIQYKNTDICMDFHCDCGEPNHYDGYFAYEIECGGCKKKFKLSEKIQITELTGKDAEVDALKPIKFNEDGEVIEPEAEFSKKMAAAPLNVITYPNFKTDVVFFDQREITKAYVAGEGKPEILAPSKAPGNWKTVAKKLNDFLKNSSGVFPKPQTAAEFIDEFISKNIGEPEDYKAILPVVAEYSFKKGTTSYKGIDLEYSSKMKAGLYQIIHKDNYHGKDQI